MYEKLSQYDPNFGLCVHFAMTPEGCRFISTLTKEKGVTSDIAGEQDTRTLSLGAFLPGWEQSAGADVGKTVGLASAGGRDGAFVLPAAV